MKIVGLFHRPRICHRADANTCRIPDENSRKLSAPKTGYWPKNRHSRKSEWSLWRFDLPIEQNHEHRPWRMHDARNIRQSSMTEKGNGKKYRHVPPSARSLSDITFRSGARAAPALVTAEWLAGWLGASGPVILNVHPRGAWKRGAFQVPSAFPSFSTPLWRTAS